MNKQLFIHTKLFTIIIAFVVLGCSESKYDKLVKEEMAKGIANDTLFLGMILGQSKKEFFDKCWKLNKEEVITNGSTNQFVKYILPKKNEDSNEIQMLFYGIFNKENIMTGMDIQFSNKAWSLWNKKVQSEQLVYNIKDTLKTWFPGNDFIQIPIKKDSSNLYVKIDGNRRITIKPLEDNKNVKVQIDNLKYHIK